jgi:hypothetical protein
MILLSDLKATSSVGEMPLSELRFFPARSLSNAPDCDRKTEVEVLCLLFSTLREFIPVNKVTADDDVCAKGTFGFISCKCSHR